MFKTYKNEFLKYIEKLELNLDDFSIDESEIIFFIQVRDTPMYFRFKLSETERNLFAYEYTKFTPNFITERQEWTNDFNVVLANFDDWLQNNVRPYLVELDEPDLWETYFRYIDGFTTYQSPDIGFEEFSDEDKSQIKGSIENLKSLIEENYQLLEEQLEEINRRLDYLSDAVDRLNRFDWRALGITMAWDIGILVGQDAEGVRKFIELFQGAISSINYLLK